MTSLFDRFPVIDVDSHITEPPDLWTSRLPAKYKDDAPHVVRVDGEDRWIMPGGEYGGSPGNLALAFFDGTFPGPPNFDLIHPAAYEAKARVELLDELGIYAQVIYPNIGGFGAAGWTRLPDRKFALACVRAYNDFLAEFAEVAPNRLLGVTAVPFWDIDAALGEVARSIDLGHRGINFTAKPESFDLPHIWERHWDPLWALAQEAGLSVNFHIGSGNLGNSYAPAPGIAPRTNLGHVSATLFLNNMQTIGDIIFGGVCHRFPDLQFVSVESGAGYVVSALEMLDWQWGHLAVTKENPDYDLCPSEYFARQISACFWFERESLLASAERLQDNLLYETDFPHPASQYPSGGPGNPAVGPRQYGDEVLSALPDDIVSKLLFQNAAAIYGVELPLPAGAKS